MRISKLGFHDLPFFNFGLWLENRYIYYNLTFWTEFFFYVYSLYLYLNYHRRFFQNFVPNFWKVENFIFRHFWRKAFWWQFLIA
jgi:hypothetical protein